MKQANFSLLRILLFWMILFFIQRTIFFVYHFDLMSNYSFQEWAMAFVKGIRLDMSMAGYFLGIPLLLFSICVFFPSFAKIAAKSTSIFISVLVIVVISLGVIDLFIYSEWGSKLNSRAIEFLILSPGEAMASSASSPIYLAAFIFIAQLFVFYFLWKKWVKINFQFQAFKWLNLILLPTFSFLLILMIRGGLQLAPINQSAVYFSTHSSLNHTALNTEWNLMASFIENHFSNENPYQYSSIEEAEAEVKELYPELDVNQSEHILNTQQPNVVLIILESFTSDVVEAFGGEAAISPTLTKLATEGIAFDSIYASGDRTDKGMIAILSAFPSQAVRTIIQQPDKFEKLQSLPNAFTQNGYESFFLYGGESEFANFKSYLLSTGIQKIIDKKDFPAEQMNSKWGAHDGFVFERLLQELKTKTTPFFSIMLSLSSHEPFEIPVKSSIEGNSLPQLFRKSAHYTDQSIAAFMEQAKKEKWYANTLFVFVADHGHRLPKEYDHAYDYRKFRIPLIFYGEVIKQEFRGKKVHTLGSQTDIAATLLQQLNLDAKPFKWSKDLFNKQAVPFAFYSFDNGFGWVEAQQTLTVDNVNREISSTLKDLPDSLNQKISKKGKAYMQKVFTEYLAY